MSGLAQLFHFATKGKGSTPVSFQIRSFVYEAPIIRKAGYDYYEQPIEGHDYVMTVDVARGVSEDYSAFVLVDITEFPLIILL